MLTKPIGPYHCTAESIAHSIPLKIQKVAVGDVTHPSSSQHISLPGPATHNTAWQNLAPQHLAGLALGDGCRGCAPEGV